MSEPVLISLQPFHRLFPDIGLAETRSVWLRDGRDDLPPGEYAFVEWYCVDPACDCQRVLWQVLSNGSPDLVATVCHAFDEPEPDALIPEQTYIDPLHPHKPFAPTMLRVMEELLLTDVNYVARLRRHYAMVKAKFEPRPKVRRKRRR